MTLELSIIILSISILLLVGAVSVERVGFGVVSCLAWVFCLALCVVSFTPSNATIPFVMSAFVSTCVLLSGFTDRGSAAITELYLTLVIVSSALILLQTTRLFWLIFSFELMTVSALVLLRLHSKYDRGLEALVEMYTWAMVGSASLLFALILIGNVDMNFGAPVGIVPLTLLMVGFVIKVPLWPFSSWLLKAHVEASTEFF